MNQTPREVTTFLDEIADRVTSDDVPMAMDSLMQGLWNLRKTQSPQEWARFVFATAPNHRLRGLLHQDPFTRHAYTQPRGYPGDAELLDFIYSGNQAWFVQPVSKVGYQLFSSIIQEPPCRAVRARMRMIAARIDRKAELLNGGRILSVACGHLREVQYSKALQNATVKELVGIDQDAQTIDWVRNNLSRFGVTAHRLDIKDIIFGKSQLGVFDFIYSAGLYDYLNDKVATKLTEALINMLSPSGTLLIANFLPDILGAGYMEVFMRWNLVYRSHEDMIGLLPKKNCGSFSISTFEDPNGNIVFLEVHRQ